MNAILIMPPKFLAVFSKREKMRRHSFNQPIKRSTMFRSRYASLSNATGLASRASFIFDGITGVMSNSNRYSSIQFARYPLSAANATAMLRRRREHQVTARLYRPSACQIPTLRGPGPRSDAREADGPKHRKECEFCSLNRHGCARSRDPRAPRRLFFPTARGALVGTHHGAIDTPQFAIELGLALQMLRQRSSMATCCHAHAQTKSNPHAVTGAQRPRKRGFLQSTAGFTSVPIFSISTCAPTPGLCKTDE